MLKKKVFFVGYSGPSFPIWKLGRIDARSCRFLLLISKIFSHPTELPNRERRPTSVVQYTSLPRVSACFGKLREQPSPVNTHTKLPFFKTFFYWFVLHFFGLYLLGTQFLKCIPDGLVLADHFVNVPCRSLETLQGDVHEGKHKFGEV